MSMIYVRAKPGRVARLSPTGQYLRSDEFTPTRLTPYLNRLANVHGDIEIVRELPKAKAAKADSAKTSSDREAE